MNIKEEFLKAYKNFVGATGGEKIYSPSELKISENSVGGTVEIINPDKTLSPAPDGTYKLADGAIYTVKDSKIESIEGEDEPQDDAVQAAADAPAEGSPAEEETETPAEEKAEDAEEDTIIANLQQTVSDLTDKVDGLVAAVAELSASNMKEQKEALAAFNSELNQVKEHVKFMAKIPLEASKTSKSNVVKDEREKQMFELGKLFNTK